MAAIALVALWPLRILSHETLTTTVLFDREIVRVLNRHCVMCHVEGGPSFPLETYEQTWLLGRKIRADVIARHMPPWAAVPGYGQFANENVVTLRESQFVVSWVEGLGPRNAGSVFTNVVDPNAPRRQPIRAHAHVGEWELGTPSFTRPLPPVTIEPRQSVHVSRVVIDLGLTADRVVRAVEFMPGDRRVVRAAFFTVQETGQWIGSWTPWYGYSKLPAGTDYRLLAGSHVIAEILYQGTAEPVIDRGTLGLFFGDESALTTTSDLVLDSAGDVPAGASIQRFHAERVIATDTAVLALRPDLHPGVKSIEVSARRPDGGTDVLLFAKDIPLDWPTPYIFRNAVTVRKGSVLSATAYYANAGSMPMPGGFRLTISQYRKRPPTTPR